MIGTSEYLHPKKTDNCYSINIQTNVKEFENGFFLRSALSIIY